MTDTMSPGEFWRAQGMRAIGAAIVTTQDENGPAGFLALSATHLTASPPIMTIAVMPTTSALAAIRSSRAFAINYLAQDAVDVHQRFAAKDAPKGAARFDGLACTRLQTGAPILPGIVGAMDCVLEAEDERFGSFILYGRIVATAPASAGATAPLVHYAGGFLGA